jgi:hypothetical protein
VEDSAVATGRRKKMPKCKTCKWWTPSDFEVYDDDEEDRELSINKCECPKVVYGYPGDVGETETPGFAYYWDHDSWQATFTPTPDFGCIHHEEKEDA